mgnify:FL=1
MKVVVQRVSKASVSVDNQVVGSIDEGLMLLVGFTQDDTLKNIDYMVNKVLNLRIFPDENGVMNKSVKDTGGSILSISQFTLYGDASKGNRPSYVKALKGEEAIKLYAIFNEKLKENVLVETGVFGTDMQIELVNMGPTTIILEK